MRIAYVTETFLPKVDGIVNTTCHLLEHLAENGHESILIAPRSIEHIPPERYAQTRIIPADGFAMPLYPELKLGWPLNTDIDREIAAFNPDLIHIINPFALGLAGYRVGRALKKPIVASYHTDIPGFATRWGLGFSADALWAYLRWLHNQADLNLCPSRFTQAELQAQGFNNVKVWTRGVDTDLYSPNRRNHEWRERLTGGRTDRPLLVYVGRISAEKRVDWLLPVIEALPQASLAIVGDGPIRADLEAQFAGLPVVFTGYLKGKELAQAYAAGDIFVFPAANETLGNVVLEAMASGLPVVAPNSGGYVDHVINGKTGILTPPEDQQALINAVRLLVEKPQLARSIGAAGRADMETKTWAATFDLLLSDYASLLPQPVRRPITWAPAGRSAASQQNSQPRV